MFDNLEVFYLANKSENIYFALLGDCSESDKKEENFDKDVMAEGLEQVKRLNLKYNTKQKFAVIEINEIECYTKNTIIFWRFLLCPEQKVARISPKL